MKSIFRYLVSEFAGYWIQAVHGVNEITVQPVKDALSYLFNVQFILEEEASGNILPMKEEDILGVGKIAGFFQPFISAMTNLGSIMFTDSHIVEGRNYSERGLFDMNKEFFRFFRTNQGEYPTDSDTLATERLRSSLVPEGAPVLGYIEEGVDVFTVDGRIDHSKISPTIPVGKAYYPYYGEKYLFLAETFLIQTYLDVKMYKEVLESLQRLRYNGTSLAELLRLTTTICGDYVNNISLESSVVHPAIIVNYSINLLSNVQDRIKRLVIWKLIIQAKFKQIQFIEEV